MRSLWLLDRTYPTESADLALVALRPVAFTEKLAKVGIRQTKECRSTGWPSDTDPLANPAFGKGSENPMAKRFLPPLGRLLSPLALLQSRRPLLAVAVAVALDILWLQVFVNVQAAAAVVQVQLKLNGLITLYLVILSMLLLEVAEPDLFQLAQLAVFWMLSSQDPMEVIRVSEVALSPSPSP